MDIYERLLGPETWHSLDVEQQLHVDVLTNVD